MNESSDDSIPNGELDDVPTAIADAIAEHENWLMDWHRALLCGVPAGDHVLASDAHLTCRFGKWFAANNERGLLDDRLIQDLGRTHRELHEVARELAIPAAAGDRPAADAYDGLAELAGNFRKLAVRIQELHGRPEDSAVDSDNHLAELQSRLTMLSELEREWARAVRGEAALSFVMVHPERTDALRHEFGQIGIDRIVAGMAARLFMHLRPYDSVFRYGQTEFLLCLPGADAAHSVKVCRRLEELIAETPFALSESSEAFVTARFGIAGVDPRATVQAALERAARAVHMAGTEPGDRIVYWSPELEQ